MDGMPLLPPTQPHWPRLLAIDHPTPCGPARRCSIDLVELPRLRLSFRVEAHPFRLCCVEHAGLVIAPSPSDKRTLALLKPMPSPLLLESSQGEQYVLLSATTLPTRPALKAALFSTTLVLDRSDHKWIAACGNAPVYLYPVSAHVATSSPAARAAMRACPCFDSTATPPNHSLSLSRTPTPI